MSFKPPKKLDLARVPTPIQPLKRLSRDLGIQTLYVKRDDLTGAGMSGNKARKLEYLLADALRKKATVVLTCGGIQSNHARATAIAATQLGIRTHLFLRGRKFEISEGNLFLDKLIGAEIRFLSPQEYNKVDSLMKKEAARLKKAGEKVYVIPEGGSNEVGVLGYIEAAKEIKSEERKIKKKFQYLVTAVGTGGTMAGLILGRKISRLSGEVIGFNVHKNAGEFSDNILDLARKTSRKFKITGMNLRNETVQIIEGYAGPGYALPYDEDIAMIKRVARTEGLLLDPVYTAKAFCGLVEEIRKGNLPQKANYLFIHTGGIFGLLAQRRNFDFL